MDGVTLALAQETDRRRSAGGFSLIEVVVAMFILTGSVLSLVGVFAVSVQRITQSTPMLIAREKAREAVESVHAARDTGELSWPTIQNVAAGGVFLGGAQPVRTPGNDGLVNTADDGPIETLRKPGPDGILGTADDETVTLTDYTREIDIDPLMLDGTATVNTNLRQITVIVRYKVDNIWRDYTLTTFVSSYS